VAFIPLPGGIKVCINFTLQSVPCSICFHVRQVGTVGQADTDDVVSVVKQWWDTTGYNMFSQDLFIDTIQATAVDAVPAVQTTESTFTEPNGGQAVESMSGGVAVVITLLTGYIGRSYRGRVFLPGIDVNAVTLNAITAPAKANYEGGWLALISALATNGRPMHVASYQENLLPRTTAVSYPVTSIIVRDYVKSQRRRNIKN